MHKLIIWEIDWADEFDTFGFDIVESEKFFELESILKKFVKLGDDPEEYYFGTNEFHRLKPSEVLEILNKAKDVDEESLKVLDKFFKRDSGMCFFDILDTRYGHR